MSGSLIGGVVGAGLAYFTGGFSIAIGWMAGSVIGGLLFPPTVDGPSLGDLKIQKSEYGAPIPVIHGTIPSPQLTVIWASDIEVVEGESGGKGSDDPTADAAYGNFAVAICEGERRLGRIWAGPDKRLIWDGAVLEGADAGATLTFYSGSETQLPDPLIESFKGAGNVSAFRGTAYVVFEHFPLLNDGNRLPFLTIEVGQVDAEANIAPENLGPVRIKQVLVTDTFYATFYYGSYHGIVIRSLVDDSLIAHYTYEAGWTSVGGRFFYDADREVFVLGNSGALSYLTVSLADGTKTSHAITEAATTDGNPGTVIQGGVYHGGMYIFAASNSPGVAERVTLYVMDPDTHLPLFTYASDTAAGSFVGPLLSTGSGSYVYGYSTPQRLSRFELALGTSPVDMGTPASAPSFYSESVKLDPTTGYIWSVSLSSGTLAVHVNDTATNTLIWSDSISTTFWDLEHDPICFGEDYVYIVGEQWLSIDAFVVIDRAVPALVLPDSGGNTWTGGYHGAADIEVMAYNPTQDKLFAVRFYGSITFGDGTLDPTQVNYLQPGTYTKELDNKYLAEADYSVVVTPEGQLLSAVLTDLHLRSGMTAGQIGFSRMTDEMVDGYAIGRQTTIRDAITALMPAYYIDMVESDGVVEVVSRGGATAVVIPDDDVGSFVSGSEPPDAIETTRRMENELPRVMNVRYLLEATNYSPAARAARRLVGSSGEEQTMDLPLVLSDTKAQEIAEVNLHGAWVARLTYSFTLPRKYGYLEPTDVIEVKGYTMRLTKTVNDDGIIKCEATHEDPAIYTPNVVVTETVPITPTPVSPTAETILELA